MPPSGSNNQAINDMIQSFGTANPQDPVFSVQQDPTYQQAPVYTPPVQPQQQAPQNQQQFPQYGQPQQPQNPAGQQSVQQQPGQQQMQPQVPQIPQGPWPEYPITTPQLPTQQQDQTPAWAQQILQAMQQGGQNQQPSGQAPQVQQPRDSDAWSDQNRPRSWSEMQKAIQETAEKIADQKLVAAQTQAQQVDAEARERNLQAQAMIDQTENQLRQYGFLPPITNPVDPNDPGVAAQRELEHYAVSIKSNDLFATATTLKALHDSGMYFDTQSNSLKRRNSQSAAARAPIFGGSPSAATAQQSGPTHGQLATMSMDQLFQHGMANNQ